MISLEVYINPVPISLTSLSSWHQVFNCSKAFQLILHFVSFNGIIAEKQNVEEKLRNLDIGRNTMQYIP